MTLKKKLSGYDTIFNRLVVSFVGLVIIVCLCMGIVYTVCFFGEYRERVEKLEQEKLDYLNERIDDLFEQANNLILDMANLENRDDSIKHYLSHAKDTDYESMITLSKYVKNMGALCSSDITGIDFHIFANGMNFSSFTGVSFDKNAGAELAREYDESGITVRYNSSNRYLFPRTIAFESMEYPVLTFGAHFPIYAKEYDRLRGYITVDIDMDAIRAYLSEYTDKNGGYISVVNESGMLFLYSGDESMAVDVLKGSSFADIGECALKAKGAPYENNGMILISSPTLFEGWNLVSVLSEKEYYRETSALIRTIILISLIILAAGLFAAVTFAKRMYNPLRPVVTKLHSINRQNGSGENELRYIDRTISELCNAVSNKDEARRERVASVHHEIMKELVKSKDIEVAELEKRFESIGESDSLSTHYMFLFSFPCKVLGKLDDETKLALTYNLTRFLEAGGDGNLRIMPFDLYNGRVACMISVAEEREHEEEKILSKLRDYVKMTFGMDIVVFRSGPVYELSEVHGEFLKLFAAIEYSYFIPYEYMIDLSTMEQSKVRRMTGDKDAQCFFDPCYDDFSEALVSRDNETLRSILEQYREAAMNIAGTKEQMNSISIRYLFLFNHFYRDIMKKSRDYDDSKLFLEINGLLDVEDFCNWLYSTITDVLKVIKSGSENPTVNVIDLVEKLVKENISEDISLDYVAQRVYLTPKYLSRVFKEEKGINFTQYVNDCKMQAAEQLLETTDKTLEEIILEVGFNSTNYFIKKFKETHNQTPAQYRKIKRING